MSMLSAALAALLLAPPVLARADSGAGLAEPASSFLASLTESERRDATWGFESAERGDVHFAPFGMDGVRLGELPDASRELGEALLAATLSPSGYARVQTIRDLERDVLAIESERFFGFATRWMRDPGRYFWAFFGEPANDRSWAFRLEGHHLSLHVTSVPGSPPATTPLFLGAQPRVVPEGLPSAGAAALGEEERLARALYASLDPVQRSAATLPYQDDRGHMLGQVARLEGPVPVGVARSALRAPQRRLLDGLVDSFAGLFSASIAAARREEVARQQDLYFAHVESEDPAHAYYTRVSGPGLLIEIDNTTDGDHVHAVWHRPGGDFADDLLAQHWEREHGVALVR
jgi:hypothetical protein